MKMKNEVATLGVMFGVVIATLAFDGASVGDTYTPLSVTALGSVAGVTLPTAAVANPNRRCLLISRPAANCSNMVVTLATVASAAPSWVPTS